MKIGIVISSLTQSIPYMTYLASNGYNVFPILLQEKIDCEEKVIFKFKNIIENITGNSIINGDFLSNEDKLDCLIILQNRKAICSIQTVDYNNFLKQNAPIIINSQIGENVPFEMQTNHTIYFINYSSINIIDECDYIISNVDKVLQKK